MFRTGVVVLAGRANVGKSTLVNAMVGQKVSIVSGRPQTTRAPVRAVLTVEGAQAIFVDTPGLHKPRTLLGQQLNRAAAAAGEGADVVAQVIDARAGAGGGDRYVAERLGRRDLCVVNKVDGMPRAGVLAQLRAVGEWGFDEYFAVSARTGTGVDELVGAIINRLPPGAPLFPLSAPAGAVEGLCRRVIRDLDDAAWVAELVREQLLRVAREELPYSIACRVTEWDWPYVRCEILVERESQKGMVIGRGGSVLKRAGSAARAQLPAGTYLDLSVRVAADWQQRPEMLKQLGL
ncbi:MAG: GTPase Era [Acidimicrobiales bacterium]